MPDYPLPNPKSHSPLQPKPLKVGVWARNGGVPDFKRMVIVHDLSHREAMGFLSEAQRRHLALQVQELATEDDPTHSDTVDVRKIEDFYEIRDRGGVLGGLSVRVFFGVDDRNKDNKRIVVLGTIKKQNNGPTPTGDKLRMRRRWRKYLKGDYGDVMPD